jgi:hypothetical protein
MSPPLLTTALPLLCMCTATYNITTYAEHSHTITTLKRPKNSVHTGSSDPIEVPVGHWINMQYLKQVLPVQLQLWTEFEQNCGRPGILDSAHAPERTVAVEPQSADLAGDSPCTSFQDYSSFLLVLQCAASNHVHSRLSLRSCKCCRCCVSSAAAR